MDLKLKSFYVGPAAHQTIEMPMGAAICAADAVDNRICLWAIANPTAPQVVRDIYLIGTKKGVGRDLDVPVGTTYISTIVMRGGEAVIHVFVKPESVRAPAPPTRESSGATASPSVPRVTSPKPRTS